nr:MgtC/SapB family protein [Sulfitobacter faviae]
MKRSNTGTRDLVDGHTRALRRTRHCHHNPCHVALNSRCLAGWHAGLERELKERNAGVRTHMLVAVGAALFLIGPLQSGMEIADLSRVLQGIVQGIGFLGAGAIIVRTAERKIQGLTTAASIWATAGIGIVAGLGLEAMAVLSTVVVLIILAVIPQMTRR